MRIVRLAASSLLILGASGCTSATDLGDPVAAVEIVAGDDQSVLCCGGYATDSLRVRVLDSNGDPLGGVTVAWYTPLAQGSVNPTSSVTDPSGFAATRASANTVGEVTVGVYINAQPKATFTLTGLAGPALVSVTYPADEVNVASGPGTVAVSAHLTTDYREMQFVFARFLPEGTVSFTSPNADWTALTLASGTGQDGSWEGAVVIPEGVTPGPYRLQMFTAPSSEIICGCWGYPRQWHGPESSLPRTPGTPANVQVVATP